jgi:hypothetical protein
LLSTAQDVSAQQIIGWFVVRGQREVTFHEACTSLGGDTQRQWSDRAIVRTTPVLVGPFSLGTLVAQQVIGEETAPTRQAAWYDKAIPTCADTLALVRQRLWPPAVSETSGAEADRSKLPRVVFERFATALIYTA